MPSTQTRRTLLKRSAGLAALAGIPAFRAVAAQSDIDSGGIGLTRDAWEAIVGAGTPLGDLVTYPNPDLDGFTILAQFDGDRLTHLEFTYGEIQEDGLPEDDVRAQVLGALPSDAGLVETFPVTEVNRDAPQYRVERFISEQLGAMSNGLASILLVTQYEIQPDAGTIVTRVSLAMPGPHTMEARAVGNPGGIGLSRAEWIDLYGEPDPVQGGDLFANGVVPDLQLRVQFKPGDRANLVDTEPVEELPPIVEYADGKALVGSLLHDDAILRYVFQLVSPPDRLATHTAELWECPSLAGVTDDIGSVLAFYDQATDTQPVTISRIAVALPNTPDAPEGATPAASPEPPSATPVTSERSSRKA